MNNTVQQHDFIELDYTGKLADGTIFDTTSKQTADKQHLPTENRKFGPVIICVGEQQILPGLDAQLVDKEIGKQYIIPLSAEQAFGKRDIKKMKIVPSSTFVEHKLNPYPGLQIDVDGEMGIVTQVSGGRVMVNFNHPLAGREVIYDVTIHRKITDQKEQIISYLTMSMHIPTENIKVEVAEGKATVQLPMSLPAPLNEVLGKKLAELTKVGEVDFTSPEKALA